MDPSDKQIQLRQPWSRQEHPNRANLQGFSPSPQEFAAEAFPEPKVLCLLPSKQIQVPTKHPTIFLQQFSSSERQQLRLASQEEDHGVVAWKILWE